MDVLVVDDESDHVELIRTILETHGATVRAAQSAAEALAKINESAPDILLSDIAMPGRDGFSLIQELRERGLRFPAIALTAHARDEDRIHALARGFQLHLSKPIDPGSVLSAIAGLMSGVRQD
jgi:CheY-like chemotaxis protein